MKFTYDAHEHIKNITDMQIGYPTNYNAETGDGKCRAAQSMAINGKTAYVIKITKNQKADIYTIDDFANESSVEYKAAKRLEIGGGILWHANGVEYDNKCLYVARLDTVDPSKYQIVKVDPSKETSDQAVVAAYKVEGAVEKSRIVRAITKYENTKFIVNTHNQIDEHRIQEFLIGTFAESTTGNKMEGKFQPEKRFYLKQSDNYTPQDIHYDSLTGTLYLITSNLTTNNFIIEYDINRKPDETIVVDGIECPLYTPTNRIAVDLPDLTYRVLELESLVVDRTAHTTANYDSEKKLIVFAAYANSNEKRHAAIFAVTSIRCHM